MILSVFSVSVVHVILYGCVLQGLHFCVMSLHDPGHDPVHLCAAGSSTAAEELHHLTAGGVLVQQRSPPVPSPLPRHSPLLKGRSADHLPSPVASVATRLCLALLGSAPLTSFLVQPLALLWETTQFQ